MTRGRSKRGCGRDLHSSSFVSGESWCRRLDPRWPGVVGHCGRCWVYALVVPQLSNASPSRSRTKIHDGRVSNHEGKLLTAGLRKILAYSMLLSAYAFDLCIPVSRGRHVRVKEMERGEWKRCRFRRRSTPHGPPLEVEVRS